MNDEQRAAAAAAIAQAAHDQKHAPPADPAPGYVPGATVNWYTLDDIAARDEWVQLRKWVEWFTVRYDIPVSVVPTCWWAHPQMVQELSSLHAAYTAWFDPDDTGLGPITWHEHLTVALARISRFYGGSCNNGHHVLKVRTWNGVTNEDAWDVWINQTHAH